MFTVVVSIGYHTLYRTVLTVHSEDYLRFSTTLVGSDTPSGSSYKVSYFSGNLQKDYFSLLSPPGKHKILQSFIITNNNPVFL